MPRFQGISKVAVYLQNPIGSETASVLFDVLDAPKSAIELYMPNKGEMDATGGRIYSGETCKATFVGYDPDRSKLAILRSWLHANRRVSLAALSSDGGTFYNWLEEDRLYEVRPVKAMGSFEGRSDFIQFSLVRTSEEPKIWAQTNLVAHLTQSPLTGSSTRREFVFPFSGVELCFSADDFDTGDGQNEVLIIDFVSQNGSILRTAALTTRLNERFCNYETTEPGTHSIRLRTISSTYILANIAVRADGSFEYTPY